MDKIKVWRVERANNPTADRIFCDADSHWYRLPCPEQDGIQRIEDHENCGCISKRQLNIWWRPQDYWKIHNAGMRIRVLEVPAHLVKKGKTQVVFPRDAAKIIGEYTASNRLKKVK